MKFVLNENVTDWSTRQTLKAIDENGATVEEWYVSDLSECPEDAIIGRDLVDCDDIMSAIQFGFNLAKNGGTIDFVRTEDD